MKKWIDKLLCFIFGCKIEFNDNTRIMSIAFQNSIGECKRCGNYKKI
jgi:hypothetical protein